VPKTLSIQESLKQARRDKEELNEMPSWIFFIEKSAFGEQGRNGSRTVPENSWIEMKYETQFTHASITNIKLSRHPSRATKDHSFHWYSARLSHNVRKW